MHAAFDRAAVQRLAESPRVGMEEAAPAVGGVAVGEFLLEDEADVLAPVGVIRAHRDLDCERHEARRAQLDVLADQAYRLEMRGESARSSSSSSSVVPTGSITIRTVRQLPVHA